MTPFCCSDDYDKTMVPHHLIRVFRSSNCRFELSRFQRKQTCRQIYRQVLTWSVSAGEWQIYIWSKLLPHCTQLAKRIFWYEHCFLNQNYWQRLLKYITPVLSGRKLNNKWNLHLINGDFARADGETANSRAWHLPIVYKPSRECHFISFVSGNTVLKQMQLWLLFGGSWLLTFILRVFIYKYL